MLESHICCKVWGLAVAAPPLSVSRLGDVEVLRRDMEARACLLSLQQQFPG